MNSRLSAIINWTKVDLVARLIIGEIGQTNDNGISTNQQLKTGRYTSTISKRFTFYVQK